MLHLQQFVLSQSFKEMGKKRIQKMGIKSFRYIESKIGDPLFSAVLLHESKVFIQ